MNMSLPHVEWRDGQPRFKPSDGLRKLGYRRQNLVSPSGAWMTFEEVQAWHVKLRADIEQAKQERMQASRAKRAAVKPRRAAEYKPFTLEDMLEALWRQPDFQTLAPKTRKDYMNKARWLSHFDPQLWHSQAASIERPIAIALYKKSGARPACRWRMASSLL